MLTGPDAFYTITRNVITTVADALVASGAERPTRVGVYDGAIAWDDCDCAGGQLAGSAVRLFVSERFPEPAGVALICDAPYLVAELAFQVVRCAPIDPSVDALDRSAQRVIADASILLSQLSRVMCGLVEAGDVDDYLTAPLVFVGPQGGCVGSEVHVHVSLLRGVI